MAAHTFFAGSVARFSLCLTLAAALPAQDVKTIALANGMKVLVQEDHAIPSVAMYFFFRVGSRNEQPGTTGLSHFFEHMMFNGAKKYGPKQFDVQMEKAGGNNNAYTSTDVTVYTDWFPPTALELMMDMESDRIGNLAFDPKIIESERGVVYSERRTSVDNSNRGLLEEQLQAAAFTAHPYQWPVVGWPSDIEAWTMDDLKAHFRKGYAPNNCTMVIVGDVTLAQVTALSKKYLEPIPRQEPPPPVRTIEPEQLGERRVEIRKAAQLPLVMVAYHTPATRHADSPAIDVLQALLTEGRTARLYKRMVDQDQLAISVNSSREETFDPNLLTFNIQPRRDVDPAKAEAALYEELDRLGTTAVATAELQKAKNQLLKAHYDDLKTLGNRANALGRYETFYGGYAKLFAFETDIDKVTAADVQRVAKQYLARRNRTVATLVPDASAPKSEGEDDEQ
jgi:zinc protease